MLPQPEAQQGDSHERTFMNPAGNAFVHQDPVQVPEKSQVSDAPGIRPQGPESRTDSTTSSQ